MSCFKESGVDDSNLEERTATMSATPSTTNEEANVTGNEIQTQEEITGNDTQIQEEIQHLEIDTRRAEWALDKVKLIEVIRAIEVEYSQDYTKSVSAMRGPLIGIFKLDADDYTPYVDKTIEIRGVHLSFIPRIKRPRQPPGFFTKKGKAP